MTRISSSANGKMELQLTEIGKVVGGEGVRKKMSN